MAKGNPDFPTRKNFCRRRSSNRISRKNKNYCGAFAQKIVPKKGLGVRIRAPAKPGSRRCVVVYIVTNTPCPISRHYPAFTGLTGLMSEHGVCRYG